MNRAHLPARSPGFNPSALVPREPEPNFSQRSAGFQPGSTLAIEVQATSCADLSPNSIRQTVANSKVGDCITVSELEIRDTADWKSALPQTTRVLRNLMRAIVVLALFCLALNTALGTERFPPPEFEPGYVMPQTTLPTPRAELLEWLDVAVLFVALSLSTWFVLKKRSRFWILGLGIASLLYFGFYRKGCVCAIGSIQDITLASFDNGYAVPLTIVAFFLLPIIFALFFGRTFCAAVCPQGAIQDLVLLKPVKMWPWLEKTLRIIPFIYLGAAILFAATGSVFIICEFDPFVALFRRGGSTTMLGLGAAFLLVGVFIGRPYCRFLCPYGALLSCVSRFSKWTVTLSPQDCIQCALCEVACPYGAIADPAARAIKKKPSKTKIMLLVLLAAAVTLLGGLMGQKLAIPFSYTHSTVRLAEQIAREDANKNIQPDEESQAFRATGRPVAELKTEALKIRHQFSIGTQLFGAFVGLILGLKLLSLSLSRPSTVFEPDAANCVSCGRCYKFCPKELSRVKKNSRKPSTSGL